MLINSKSQNQRVAYTDFTLSFTIIPISIKNKTENWSGVHLFSRYQTENDLYVASLRVDGLIVIKKKIKGHYTTLAQKKSRIVLELQKEYTFTFSAMNNNLRLTVTDQTTIESLEAVDSDLRCGTGGLRLDNIECYIRDVPSL